MNCVKLFTLAPSHLAQTSLAVGSAAETAEACKRLKYAGLGAGFHFYPVAIETLGAWGKDAQGLVAELGGRLATLTGDPRSLAFLRQRIGIAIQRGKCRGNSWHFATTWLPIIATSWRSAYMVLFFLNVLNCLVNMVVLHIDCNRSLAFNLALLAKIARIGCMRKLSILSAITFRLMFLCTELCMIV